MTAFIVRINPDWLRQLIWLFWFPVGVYVDLWWRFRHSCEFDALVWASWDLGWKGIKK